MHGDVAEVTLSALKNRFHEDLSKAQKALYKDATAKKWFSRNPDSVRTLWALIGLATIAGGVALGWLLGWRFGAAFIAAPIALCGLLLLATHRAMPRRTAHGSELLRRVLGFHRYITTAESDRQRFSEQANIFAEYLPYAIVFGAVERWARAFRDIDTTAATAAWYAGSGIFSTTTTPPCVTTTARYRPYPRRSSPARSASSRSSSSRAMPRASKRCGCAST